VPNLSTKIYQQLGYGINFNHFNDSVNDSEQSSSLLLSKGHDCWGCLPAGQAFGQAEPVFQKLVAPIPELEK
jgi:methionyl-tRNA synthetase